MTLVARVTRVDRPDQGYVRIAFVFGSKCGTYEVRCRSMAIALARFREYQQAQGRVVVVEV